MFNIILLPTNFVASTTAVMVETLADLAPFTLLVIGVILGVVVIEILIGALRK